MKGKRGWGQVGEDYAARLLTSKGYVILERNFRCKLGEIDIIALDGDTLVFGEVKARWSRKYGLPQEAVNARKQLRIKRTAEYYMLSHPSAYKKMRIDVIALEMQSGKVLSARIIKVI